MLNELNSLIKRLTRGLLWSVDLMKLRNKLIIYCSKKQPVSMKHARLTRLCLLQITTKIIQNCSSHDAIIVNSYPVKSEAFVCKQRGQIDAYFYSLLY